MKAKSNTMPNGAFKVEKRGVLADISFFENTSAIKVEDILTYEYDHYLLVVPYREGLEELISLDYTRWIQAARDAEQAKPQAPTIEERVTVNDGKIATLEEELDAIFGGV